MTQIRNAATLCLALYAGAANAQFMDMLKSAVTNAATSAATNAASTATSNAINGAIRGATQPPAASAPNPGAQGLLPTTKKPSSWIGADPPPMYGRPGCRTSSTPLLDPLPPKPADFPDVSWPTEEAPCAHRFTDYKFEAGKAQTKAFEAIGNAACPECKKAAVDARARSHYSVMRMQSKNGKGFDEYLATMPLQGTFEWVGERYDGSLELVGEQPIGSFPCRQFHWTLRTKKTRDIVAEREGLYCVWAHDLNDPTWTEVF